MEEENKLKFSEQQMSEDSMRMIDALMSVLKMKEVMVGVSSMLAILSTHFLRMDMPKEEFIKMCESAFEFYKKQKDEEDAENTDR